MKPTRKRIQYIWSIHFFSDDHSSFILLVPDHPPPNVTAFNTSSTSINVTWQPIPSDHVNGILLKYHIKYWRRDKTNDNVSMVTVGSSTLYAELKGLGKYKEYFVQVAGSTVAGLGNFSESVFVRTEQDGTPYLIYCAFY